MLPVDFTAEAIGQIGIKATSADYATNFNDMVDGFHSSGPGGLQGGPVPTSQSPRFKFTPLLVKFLAAEPDIRPTPFKHDAICVQTIADLQRHIAEPEQYPFPPQADKTGEEELLFMLRSIHVQAIAVQLIAREMNWYSVAEVVPLLPHQTKDWDYQEMIDELAWYLKSGHFQGYPYVQLFDPT